MSQIYTAPASDSISIVPLTAELFSQWLSQQPDYCQQWVKSCQFKAGAGQLCSVPDSAGKLQQVLVGVKDANDFWTFGGLPEKLPEAKYTIVNRDHFFKDEQYQRAMMAWGLGCYQFDEYVKTNKTCGQLCVPTDSNIEAVTRLVENIHLVRDLINLPANNMGPTELAQVATNIAEECKAEITVIEGPDLIAKNFPSIYTVGQGAEKAPCLIDLRWGNESAPKVTLVGKGVCFDSGGLDLKSAAGMRLMKKDMGGSAHVLGLARLIMQSNLPIRLRVLIPAVENSVDGKSYRPGDVIKSRNGKTVEVGNTDAEGRVVLSDALVAASEEKPDYLIDFATLTGAARIALGPDLAALFSNSDEFADGLLAASHTSQDPMWRLPLYAPYADLIKGEIADISNTGKMPLGGAITAGLFLQHFVDNSIPWAHFDIMAYNVKSSSGRPQGGEAMALRAVFQFLRDKFA